MPGDLLEYNNYIRCKGGIINASIRRIVYMNRIFRPTFTTMLTFFLGHLMGWIGLLLIIWLFFNSSNILEKIVSILFVIPYIFVISITIIYPIRAQLCISDTGITYQHPYFTIFCSWSDIQAIEPTYDGLILRYNEMLLQYKSSYIRKNLNNTIPISNFVKSYRKRKDWEDDYILSTLKKRIPIPDAEIEMNFK